MLSIDGRKAFISMLEDKMMLPRYAYIMQTVDKVNVKFDREFQKAFNGFYKVRFSNVSCYKGFYQLFEKSKKIRGSLTYDALLDELHLITGRVEASFASKILATLNTDQPILDCRVLEYLHVKLSGRSAEEKLNSAKAIYSQIEKLYEEYMKTEEARKNVAIFDDFFPDYAWISSVKKIDYMMWGSSTLIPFNATR